MSPTVSLAIWSTEYWMREGVLLPAPPVVVSDNPEVAGEVLHLLAVGRKNSIHGPSLLGGPVKDSRQVENGGRGQRDQVGGESDRGVCETQRGPHRRESVPASAVDRAATPDATTTAP